MEMFTEELRGRYVLKAVDTIGNYSKIIIIIIKPYLVSSNGVRLIV